MSHSRSRKVAWRSGSFDAKPSSVVQSLILSEQKPRCSRRFYNLQNHILHQVQKSRLRSDDSDGLRKTKKQQRSKIPRGLKLAKGARSPHMVLTPSTSGILRIIDGKIVWRYLKRAESSKALVAFGDVQPSREGEIRELFCFSVEERKITSIDWFEAMECAPSLEEIACSVSQDSRQTSSSDSERKIESLNIRVLSNSLDFVRFSVHKRYEVHHFPIECRTNFNEIVSVCEDNRCIAIEGERSSLPKGILAEFLIVQYPNLRVMARMQIVSSVRGRKKCPANRFTICLPFLVGYCPNGSIELYDLFKVLKMANPQGILERDSFSVTHEIKELPEPVVINAAVRAQEDDWVLYTPCYPGFCVVKSNNACQLFEITDAGAKELNCEIINTEPVEYASFLRYAAPRVICVGASPARVFEIVMKETAGGRIASHLIQVFPIPEQAKTPANEDASVRRNRPLRHLRGARPKVPYAAFRNSQVLWRDNVALGQVAVVSFEVGAVTCSVYDNESFELLYSIKPKHFRPTEDEVADDELELDFENTFIAVRHEGSHGNKKVLYVFNIYPSVATDID